MKMVLPKKEDVWGNDKLTVFNDNKNLYGVATDFLKVLNVKYDSFGLCKWIVDEDCDNNLLVVDTNGSSKNIDKYLNVNVGIRPMLVDISYFDNLFKNFESIFLGQYPKRIVDGKLSILLDKLSKKNLLKTTNLSYTFYVDNELVKHDEYVYNGKYYIKMKCSFGIENKRLSENERKYFKKYLRSKSKVLLSNGKTYEVGDYVWMEVLPILWLIDQENKVLISAKPILANFSDKYLNEYLNEYLYPDIMQRVITLREDDREKSVKLERKKGNIRKKC